MNFMRKSLFPLHTLFLLPILAMVLFSCREPKAAVADHTVKVAYLPITHALALYETARSKAIRVELIKYGSWPELLDALNTGRVDAASVLIEPAMKAREQGIGVTAVVLGHKDGNVVVVGKDIADANGLRGKTFAIPHRSSSHNILFREVLERNNIPEKDVKLIELPPPEMPSALASGRIAGYCVAEPFGAIAVNGGYGRILYQSNTLWNDSICCALVANDRFLREKPELAKKFVAEYRKAGKRLAEKGRALTDAKEFLKQPEPVLEKSLEWISYDDLTISKAAYEALLEKVRKYGISSNPPSFDTFVKEIGTTE